MAINAMRDRVQGGDVVPPAVEGVQEVFKNIYITDDQNMDMLLKVYGFIKSTGLLSIDNWRVFRPSVIITIVGEDLGPLTLRRNEHKGMVHVNVPAYYSREGVSAM